MTVSTSPLLHKGSYCGVCGVVWPCLAYVDEAKNTECYSSVQSVSLGIIMTQQKLMECVRVCMCAMLVVFTVLVQSPVHSPLYTCCHGLQFQSCEWNVNRNNIHSWLSCQHAYVVRLTTLSSPTLVHSFDLNCLQGVVFRCVCVCVCVCVWVHWNSLLKTSWIQRTCLMNTCTELPQKRGQCTL